MNMMDPQLAELVLAECRRRVEEQPGMKGASLAKRIRAELFGKQREFIDDPARSKAMRVARRGGKTRGITSKILDVANGDPANQCLYLNPMRQQAENVMWSGPDGLKVACARLGIRAHFNNQSLIATMPNGARIYVGGAEKRQDIEQYRGWKFKLVVIDEAGSFRPHLEALVTEVLQPALMDLLGELIMAGTPPKILAGLFYQAIRDDADRNEAYKLFTWDIHDNPHIKDPDAFHDWILETNGWTRENSTFRREYLGHVVREEATLVYPHYSAERNGYRQMPKDPGWMHVLGIDFGYDDEQAFRVISFSPTQPKAYFGRWYKQAGMTLTKIGELIRRWDGEYGFVAKVADTGGGGKQMVAELNERFSLGIEPADKASKAAYIDLLNDDLQAGRLMVPVGDPIIDEWSKLQWNEIERLKGGERVKVKIEDPRMPNHLSDASLYAWRESKHFAYEAPGHVPSPDDDDFPDYEAEQMLAEAEDRFGGNQGYFWEEGWPSEMGSL